MILSVGPHDSLSDRQIDALVDDSAAPIEDLQGVADLLREMKAVAVPDRHTDFSALFAAAARESRVTPFERFADEHLPAPKPRRPQLLRRVAITGVAVWAFVAMSTGLAYAANGAKPGDLLYGLDRAFERIGIGDGGAGERLAEALALAVPGVEPSDAVHDSEILSSPPTTALAPTTGVDDPGSAPNKPEPSEAPRDDGLPDDPGEDREPLDGEDGSTASVGAGPPKEPSPDEPDEPDEPTTTDDEPSVDPTDPIDDPSETGDDPGEPAKGDESNDPPDPDGEPEEEPPPIETPGAEERLRGVIGELHAIVAGNPGSPLADKVEDAAAKATTALEELEKTPPDHAAAAGNIEGAIGDLEAAVADERLDPIQGQRLIDRLAGIANQLQLKGG